MKTVFDDMAERWARENAGADLPRAFIAGARALRDELESLRLPVMFTVRVRSLMEPSNPMKVSYIGARCPKGGAAVVMTQPDVEPLPLQAVERHAMDWGPVARESEGSRALAAALLADATGGAEIRRSLVERFELEVLSHLPARGFQLTRAEVLRWLEVAPGTHEPQRWRHDDVPEEDLPF